MSLSLRSLSPAAQCLRQAAGWLLSMLKQSATVLLKSLRAAIDLCDTIRYRQFNVDWKADWRCG